MVHTDCLNYIIKKKGFKSYLEIGVNRRESNFDLIECQFKIGVDPEPKAQANFLGTSDEFFEMWLMDCKYIGNSFHEYTWKSNPLKFDCIFVDGLHHADQVVNDIKNSVYCLNEGGVLIVHDTDPKEERFAVEPRVERGRWNGSVYKVIPYLNLFGLMWKTLDYEANGVTVCKVISPRVLEVTPSLYESVEPFKDFQDFQKRRELLNLCTKQEFEAWI